MNRHINYYLLAVVSLLTILGILFFVTLSTPASLQKFKNTYHYSVNQFFHLILGSVLAFVAFKTPLIFIKKIAPILFFLNILALIAVFIPFVGAKFEGATRWIVIGSFNFQPSEFFKLTSILYFSAWLSEKFSDKTHNKKWLFSAKKAYNHKQGGNKKVTFLIPTERLIIWGNQYNNLKKVFVPFCLFLGSIAAIFYFQRDISTLGIITFTLIVLYFIAGASIWHLVLISGAFIVSFTLFIASASYRIERIKVFLSPETDPLGIGLHLKQSLIAIGSGGIFGKGWGMSSQKFGSLPQALSDSLFAIIGEETGLIGSAIVIILFLLFLWQGLKIANLAHDQFSKLVCVGIITWILSQAFFNILSSIGFFPISGVPLPFLNYGGSHIISEMIAVGILLNISKNT